MSTEVNPETVKKLLGITEGLIAARKKLEDLQSSLATLTARLKEFKVQALDTQRAIDDVRHNVTRVDALYKSYVTEQERLINLITGAKESNEE